jgi:hypothetical protein
MPEQQALGYATLPLRFGIGSWYGCPMLDATPRRNNKKNMFMHLQAD